MDFKFSGNISVDNVVILNKEKDTVFYSPEIIVNSKSLQKVIINDELNFNYILIKMVLLNMKILMMLKL